MKTAQMRSSRLKELEAMRPGAEGLLGQQASQVRETSNNQQSFSPNKSASKLLQLPVEVRLLIFSHLVTAELPVMIVRCQKEEEGVMTLGSPREIYSFHHELSNVQSNDDINLAMQPPIARVCHTFRDEALPLWYSECHFWLIHSEAEANFEIPLPRRGFNAWISQTPRSAFNFMRHISLCGYYVWGDRVVFTVDLETRQLDSMSFRRHAPNGHEVPDIQQNYIDSTKQALASTADADGLAALQAVLAERDAIFPMQVTARGI